ncbi:MAG: hypothetical protein JO032_08900, partial [Alphaproteobacteria bacterium]|nr:hypothetical protein [Alphaproteobacteria bacterium]
SLGWGWRAAAGVVSRTRLSPLARLGALTALIVHVTFVLTGALQSGMPRYIWAMWPGLAIMAITGVVAVTRAAAPYLSQQRSAGKALR